MTNTTNSTRNPSISRPLMRHEISTTYYYIARNKKQTYCSLSEETLFCKVQTKNQMVKEYQFRYSDIDKIHLGLSDVSWHTIDIYFRDKTHIHLKSVTFFIEKEDGKLRRPKINESDNTLVMENQKAYREFVIRLHERISVNENIKDIQFTHGNPWKKALIWALLLALFVCIPISWKIKAYRWSLFFGSAFLILFLYYRRINFRKRYLPHNIPQKYLPNVF